MKKLFWILGLAFGLSISSCGSKGDPADHIIVIVKYKAQPNKVIDALTNLKTLMDEVKKEDHFVSVRIHVDQKDNSNILLYEEWDDEEYYKNQHMKTKHLEDFIVASQEFIVAPPDITYWKVNASY